ncbi:MAG TPA: protein kinase [Myxococcaceae bacterium]|nr:protein kinase [Myxococcaceae bacterium]
MGPYEVLALLGTGGMAEVYRARDIRLGREVAIKVVSESLGGHEAWLERLQREAQLAGALNHPNVVSLYDVGVHDTRPFFVTELLEGESLRERLIRGPVPIATALEWAGQVARGLAAAHERGIIHRDLKPENLFLTRNGQVKLLDFGIAKLIEAVQRSTAAHPMMDETLPPSVGATGTGVVLGTPGYMSPEQVRGDPLDARTDLFSLGAILFEMLAGRRAFPASSFVESGYAILHSDPEPLPPTIPPVVAEVVARCLEKERDRRFQSARDLGLILDSARRGEAPGGEGTLLRPQSTVEPPASRRSAGASRPLGAGLPRTFTPLVGRDPEVRSLVAALASAPLVTITGPGGIGKTRVAVAVAESVPVELVRRVAFVDLAAVGDPALVPRAVAGALRLRDLPYDLALNDAVVSALQEESVLIVFDNCEHLVGACAELAAAVLAGCEGVRLLATSQLPLGVTGEMVYRLAPLAAPPDEPAPSDAEIAAWRTQYPALELLVQRLRAVDPAFELTVALAPLAAEICRQLDGLPLALELVAPRSRVLSLREIASQLEKRFQLLSKGDRSAPSRHQGLGAVLEWSYALLSPKEQRALERLSVFAGTFAQAAAAAVCGPLADDPAELVDLLQGLVEKSLVMVQRAGDDTRRFRLLETVRHYAQHRLGAGGDRDDARARLLGWAVSIVEGTDRSRQWTQRVLTEYDNIRAAFDYSQGAPELAVGGLRLAAGLWLHWFGRGDKFEHRKLVERALASAPDAPASVRAEAYLGLAVVNHTLPDASVLRSAATAGLGLAQELRDDRLEALAGFGLTWAEIWEHKPQAGAVFADAGIAAARRAGIGWVLALCLQARSACASESGELPLGLACMREAMALLDEQSPAVLHMYLRFNLGLQAFLNGEHAEAARAWRQGLDEALALSVRRGAAGSIEGAAYLSAAAGGWAVGARLLSAADRIRVEVAGPLLPHWISEHARVEARARAALGSEFEVEQQAGAALPFKEAAALALSVLDGLSPAR